MRNRYRDDMSMDEIMRRWPAAVRVAIDHELMCVGCPIAIFHTLEDAIREHGADADELRAALRRVTGRDGSQP